MNRGTADDFLRDGCGRCDRYRTPACKVHDFAETLSALRELLRASGLTETMKWGSPCYVLGTSNVVLLVARKESAGLAFFKGSLLDDAAGLLVAPGPDSQASRELRFTSVEQLAAQREQVLGYLAQAIALEEAGARVRFATEDGPAPKELQAALDEDPALREAWGALSRGRRRSHILYVEGGAQEETRRRRAAKCGAKIRAGKGWNER